MSYKIIKNENGIRYFENGNWIDLSNIKKINKRNFDWHNSIGEVVKFDNGDGEEKLIIKDYYLKRSTEKSRLRQHLKISYNGNDFDISMSSFMECGFNVIKGNIARDFRYDIGDIINGLIIIDRINENNCKKYNVRCQIDGYTRYVTETQLRNNVGCSVCNGKAVMKGVNDVATTNPELTKYFLNIEDAYRNPKYGKTKVQMVCPDCGFIKSMYVTNLVKQGFSCERCGDGISYPNKIMFSLLKELNVYFINEYVPDWLKTRRYDFYIPSKKILIEMDGHFHYKNNSFTGDSISVQEEVDSEKDIMANQNGFSVIRIDCNYPRLFSRTEYIKNEILHSELAEVFDLSSIDFNIVLQNAAKSKMIEVKDLYNNGYTVKKIVKETGLSRHTVSGYLCEMSSIGLCNYETKSKTA